MSTNEIEVTKPFAGIGPLLWAVLIVVVLAGLMFGADQGFFPLSSRTDNQAPVVQPAGHP